MSTFKGIIGILTGGGDVPGINPAIRAITIRALREGYQVLGIQNGWAGLVDLIPDKKVDNSENVQILTEDIVNRVNRKGGTFIHTSRTRPSHIPLINIPAHLKDKYTDYINDLTIVVLNNLEFLKIDTLITIGGDDTLSYANRLHNEGVNIIAIPKSMDNDIPGTDYSIGFSTAVSKTIKMANELRTTVESHKRLLVIEVFGRYSGFTALLPTVVGAADRCVIPEYKFDIEHLAELLIYDHQRNPDNYAIVLVSEGAMFERGEMIFKDQEADAYGHKKLGGIGDLVSTRLKELSAKYNQGRRINIVNQKLGFLVRCGEPDLLDSIVANAFGNLAMDLLIQKKYGLLTSLRNGCYTSVPIEVTTSYKKIVDVDKYYNVDRLRPNFKAFENQQFLLVTGHF